MLISSQILNSRRGWTIIELIIAIIVMAILATFAGVYVGTNQDGTRFEETRKKMLALRAALIGDDVIDEGGNRTHFGYLGDMGRLPTALTDLVTIGTQVAWAYDATLGFGAGWRGPYVNSQLLSGIAIDKDGWNNSFVYDTSGTATLKSLGSDNLSGGSAYAGDATMQIPQTLMFATVQGVVSDGEARMGSKTVAIRYPSNGSIVSISGATSALGAFSLSGIPYGVRTVQVSGSPALGPNRFIVDQPTVVIPTGALDFGGKAAVTYVTSSLASTGTNTYDQVLFDVNSSYGAAVTAAFITVTWSQLAYLTSIVFDVTGTPVTENISNATSGTRNTIGGSLVISAGATNFRIKLVFASNPDGTGNADMRDAKIGVAFQWTGNNKKDSVNFTTPTS